MAEQRDVVGSILTRIRDLVTTVTVYGDPIERGGVTVIPASLVVAGGGGGGGNDKVGGTGEGGGVGMIARPVGAYVIREGNVSWKPAISPGVIVLIALIGTRLVRRAIRSLG
ncbi:MAG TPA: sporulation protein [Acidimicrobiia bacterium]|nr:sporulation protein [Acidimicrobiia bacterium]